MQPLGEFDAGQFRHSIMGRRPYTTIPRGMSPPRAAHWLRISSKESSAEAKSIPGELGDYPVEVRATILGDIMGRTVAICPSKLEA